MAKKKKIEIDFTKVTSWDNYKPLLYLALEETKTGDVIEMGCGEGSTKFLHDYCEQSKRKLFSFDSNNEYKAKYEYLQNDNHKVTHVGNWSELYDIHKTNATVVLIDHSPGEDRGERLSQWKGFQGIIVCHDSEPSPCGGNYGWKFNEWKYIAHIKVPMNGDTNGTWATAISDNHDLTKWNGKEFASYKVEC